MTLDANLYPFFLYMDANNKSYHLYAFLGYIPFCEILQKVVLNY